MNGILFPWMPMLVNDDLLPAHVDPKCARVRPAHTVEPMESIVDSDLESGFDFPAVSIDSAAVVAGERAFDDRRGGVNVVKVGHDRSPFLAVSIAAILDNEPDRKLFFIP